MPNLEQHAVTAWLTELRPEAAAGEWPPAIRAVETQTDMPQRLAEFGAALDDLAMGDLLTLAAGLRAPPLRDELSAVLAQLGAARVLRLLHWLSETDVPDCHAVIAAMLQDDGRAGQALRAAVDAVTRHVMLRHVFAADRIAALANACLATAPEAA